MNCSVVLLQMGVADAHLQQELITMGRSFLDNQVGPAQLEPARIQAPDVQALLAPVEVHPDEQFTARYPQEPRITMRAKERVFVKEQFGYEGGLANPLSWDRTVDKFHWLSEACADEDLQSRLIQTVQQLDAMPLADLADLLAQVRPSALFPHSLRHSRMVASAGCGLGGY